MSTEKQINIDGWQPLTKAPYSSILSTTKINESEFIVVCYRMEENNGIYKYNLNTNSWTVFNNTKEQSQKFHRGLLTTNENTKQIHMLQPQWHDDGYWNDKARVHLIDINTKQIIESFDTNVDLGTNPSCLFIDGTLHIISGLRNCAHYKWNIKTHIFDKLGSNNHWRGLQCSGFVHIASKNMLLSFGGYYNNDIICKTSLDMIHWEKMDVKLPVPMAQNGHVLTSDEKYIILFGKGFNHFGHHTKNDGFNSIYILNVDTWTFMKSLYKMPSDFTQSGSCAQLMCNTKQNKLIVSGYARRTYNGFMPKDIIHELLSWSLCDEIHLFEYDTGLHWKINIADILAIQICL